MAAGWEAADLALEPAGGSVWAAAESWLLAEGPAWGSALLCAASGSLDLAGWGSFTGLEGSFTGLAGLVAADFGPELGGGRGEWGGSWGMGKVEAVGSELRGLEMTAPSSSVARSVLASSAMLRSREASSSLNSSLGMGQGVSCFLGPAVQPAGPLVCSPGSICSQVRNEPSILPY